MNPYHLISIFMDSVINRYTLKNKEIKPIRYIIYDK